MDPNQQPMQPQQPVQPVMTPEQMATIQQPVATTEMPVQPMATAAQPTTPVAAAASVASAEQTISVEEQMVAEMENSRMAEEQQARVAAEAAAVAANKPKGNKGMLVGLICAIVLAIGGIGFGVLMMMQKNSEATSYDKQIATLKKTNAELTEQLSALVSDELDDATALALVREAAESENVDYAVEYASIYGIYEDSENETTSYWVKYVAKNAEGTLTEYNATAEEDEDGAWVITLMDNDEVDQSVLEQYTLVGA